MITEIPGTCDTLYFVMRISSSAVQDVESFEHGFDCFIVNRYGEATALEECLGRQIASRVETWVEVLGTNAEAIHDNIDSASVHIGRQAQVGDGEPMTAWHDDIFTDRDIAHYIMTGGLGAARSRLVVINGSEDDASSLMRTLIAIAKVE